MRYFTCFNFTSSPVIRNVSTPQNRFIYKFVPLSFCFYISEMSFGICVMGRKGTVGERLGDCQIK